MPLRLQLALLRWAVPTKEAHDVFGFRVVIDNKSEGVKIRVVLSRLDESLRLIERYQPWRLRHMRRDIKQIWIAPFPRRGGYLVTGTCVLDFTFLAGSDSGPPTVAATLIHEGMHARISHRGIKYAGPSKARQERICVRAQLEFGRSLPEELGAGVVKTALYNLQMQDANISPPISWVEMKRKYFKKV